MILMYLIGAQGTLLSQTSVGLNITVAVRYLIITICISVSDNHRITKAIPVLESSRTCPWSRRSSRTQFCVLGLVLQIKSLALALKVKSLALSKVRARLGDKMLADLVYLKCNKRI